MVILILKWDELLRDREIFLEDRADLAGRIPLLPDLPIVLAVKNMLLGERNLP